MQEVGTGDLAALLPVAVEQTVENQITKSLRTLIVEGSLRPGVRLRYREVAARLGVSVTPVRVSIRDLALDGLVTVADTGAVRVAALTTEEVDEIYSARAGLESLLARRGVASLTPVAIRSIERRVATLQRIARQRDVREFLDAVWECRRPCYEAADRPRILERVWVYVTRCRRYNFVVYEAGERLEKALAYNVEFAEACASGDASRAATVIRESNEWTRDLAFAMLESIVPSGAGARP
jgi:DNA-binding GntR family transcriptional regulator